MSKDCNDSVQVVIPYVQSEVNINCVELLLASMALNADFCIKPVFVGDKVCGFPSIPFAPDCSHDIPGAIVTAVHSDLIDERFLVASPKFMMLNKAPLAYFAIPLLRHGHPGKYDMRFPMLVEKSHMKFTLEAISAGLYEPDADALELYHDRYSEVAMDVDWQASPFLLPVVSEHPQVDAFMRFAEKKVGAYIEHDSASDDLFPYAIEQIGLDVYDIEEVLDSLKYTIDQPESSAQEPDTDAPQSDPDEEAEEEEPEQPEPEAAEAESKD